MEALTYPTHNQFLLTLRQTHLSYDVWRLSTNKGIMLGVIVTYPTSTTVHADGVQASDEMLILSSSSVAVALRAYVDQLPPMRESLFDMMGAF